MKRAKFAKPITEADQAREQRALRKLDRLLATLRQAARRLAVELPAPRSRRSG